MSCNLIWSKFNGFKFDERFLVKFSERDIIFIQSNNGQQIDRFLSLAILNPRIRIDGCWSRYGIGIERPETILWDPCPSAYRSLWKHPRVAGSSSSLKRRENFTMYLFLRRASTSPSLKPKCGYILNTLTVVVWVYLKNWCVGRLYITRKYYIYLFYTFAIKARAFSI